MLLGPPRVERDGAAVAFDTRKAVALLAVLALADRPRPRDVLAELLWPEHDAEHARGALRRTLSALRSAVGADFVDATRDQRLPRAQRRAARSTSTASGPPRPRAGAGDAAARVPRRLPRGLRAARRARRSRTGSAPRPTGCGASSALVLARLVEATGDLAVARRWLELDPLHEPAHRALIRLYAEQGDRAAALAQYRECVRTLSRELGVPPLAETTRLYEAISEGTLEAPAAPPVVAAARAPRARRWSGGRASGRRCSAPTTASRADGRVVLLEGEAGIGKTRLAEELVAALRARGAAVLGGRAYEEEAALAYGPLVEALRGRLREDDAWVAAVRRARARRGGAAAGRSERLPSPAARRSGRAGALPRRRVGDARRRGGRAGAGRARRSTTSSGPTRRRSGCSTYGARRLAGRRLLVLLTSREPLRRVGGSAIELARLGEDEVGELLRAPRAGRRRSRAGSTRRPRGCRSCSSSTSTRSAPTRTGRCPRARASCCWRASSRSARPRARCSRRRR